MPRKLQEYATPAIEVTFEPALCIHARRCVTGLPAVFDVSQRPWVMPENAPPDEIARVIGQCPSGALRYRRLDGAGQEQPDARTTIEPQPDGPLYVRGSLAITEADGTVREATRAALCRCGQSQNKPHCDNSHLAAGFHG